MSALTSQVFALPNGTYSFSIGTEFGYTESPTTGNVTIKGEPVAVAVTFKALPAYAVKFTESGQPSGSGVYWLVKLGPNNGSAQSGSTITFDYPNGTYSFAVPDVELIECGIDEKYTPSPASGSVTVSGATVQKAIKFTDPPNPNICGAIPIFGFPWNAALAPFLSMSSVVIAALLTAVVFLVGTLRRHRRSTSSHTSPYQT